MVTWNKGNTVGEGGRGGGGAWGGSWGGGGWGGGGGGAWGSVSIHAFFCLVIYLFTSMCSFVFQLRDLFLQHIYIIYLFQIFHVQAAHEAFKKAQAADPGLVSSMGWSSKQL